MNYALIITRLDYSNSSTVISVHPGSKHSCEDTSSSLSRLLLFTLYQPFIIHDMKSLMEGEQIINCRQIPCQEHQQQQQQLATLTAGHAG